MRLPPKGRIGGRVTGCACTAALLATALAACSSFSPPPANAVDPNLYPANYKATVLTFLQTNPFGLTGALSAELSPPALKAFGAESRDSRYVACMRVAGPDWRKEKMAVFYGGEINQFVDASEAACQGAAYAPFPELAAMLAQLRGQKK
jgi:hypothetical protein